MPPEPSAAVSGLVLAAGAGRRFGGPKALARTAAGTPWLVLAVRSLLEGGCRDVTVLLGAAADEATALVPAVDTPDVVPAAVARVRRRAAPDALSQATYDGAPGHPVLLGREHWAPLSAAVRGDVGARPYLIAREAELVECGDLWSGADRDERA
jgi:CTP:molybdopterin cytidylyltransferase MocA